MKGTWQPLALGAGVGVLLAGVFAVALTLLDGCYDGDPGYGLCAPSDEVCLERVADGAVE